MNGRLTVIGIGPGAPDQITPEAAAALRDARALYGYGPARARKWLMVDLGVAFASVDLPGVDLIMPDLSFIEKARQDLVGVIARKSYLSGREIGAIEIADRFSLVEVPETAADDVVAALRQVSIKGRKATVRRERYRAAR